MNLLNFK